MAAQKGPLLEIKQGDGGSPEAFTKVAGIRAKTVNQDASPIDTTTDEDINLSGVSMRTYIGGVINYGVTGSGVAKDKATALALEADFFAGTARNYQIKWTDRGVWSGAFFIASFNITGESEGAITFDITLQPTAAVDWTPEVSAPVNALAPAVSGIARVDQTLTVIEGIWDMVTSYTYQWETDDGGGYDPIVGATARTYVPIVGQIGQPIRCVVTAVNSAGSTPATSSATADVIAA